MDSQKRITFEELRDFTIEEGDLISGKFDYTSVHALMVVNNWKWYNGSKVAVPSIEEMKETVRALLATLINSKQVVNRVGTGGFVWYRFQWETSVELQLTFNWKSMSATYSI